MTKIEAIERALRIHDKFYLQCYALFDALNRFGKTFDHLEKCQAYQRAYDAACCKVDALEAENG